MRVLFSFVGGEGHVAPLLPIARAATAAGHVVAFAGGPRMAATVEAAGFAFHPVGSAGAAPRRIPLRPLSADREDRVLRDAFAGRLARERAAAMLALCARWRPDVVVCDETDFGAMLAAERLGIPSATVLVIAAGTFVRPELVAGPLDELRAELGLPPDPELAMPARHLVLAPFPPGYRDPSAPLPATAHAVRPAALDVPAGVSPPTWVRDLGARPTVYATLGTVFGVESGDLLPRVVAGLRELPFDLVVTVGRDIDPAELGPQPAHVRVERYVPQEFLLPRCDLVVTHGGSGTVIGALAHGRPLVCIPMGADQAHNAARCRDLGVARVLDPLTATPASIREAVTAMLADPAYRRAVQPLRREAQALPGPDHAVTLLERLASPTPAS